MNEPQDMALESLLRVAKEKMTELPSELLKQIYLVEKEHQFNDDPKARFDKLHKLINDSLNESARGDG